MKNKKSQFLIPVVILVGFIIIGGVLFFTQQAKAQPVTQDEVKNTIPNPTPISPEQCPSGQARDNSGNCILIQCPQGQVRQSDGSCRMEEFSPIDPGTDTTCKPSGFIKSAFVRNKGNVNEVVENPLGSYPAVSTFQFQVTSSCKARYYFESGLEQGGQAATILQPAGSKCDGNNHYAGRFITMDKNTIVNQGGKAGVVDIAFFPIDYGKDEKLRVKGGVYTGCFKDDGKAIAEIPVAIIDYNKGFNKWSANEITNSWVKVTG